MRSAAALLLGLMFAGLAAGQGSAPRTTRPPGKTPREYEPIPLSGNPERLLEDLLKTANGKVPEWAQELIRNQVNQLQNKSTPELQKLLDEYLKQFNGGNQPSDPVMSELIKKLSGMRDLKGEGGTEALRELSERFLKDSEFAEPILKDLAGKLPVEAGKLPTEPPAPQPAPHPGPPPAMPAEGPPEDQFARWLADWLQDEEGGGAFADLLKDSPALQEAMSELTRSLQGVNGAGGWLPQMPNWAPPMNLDLRPPKLPFGLGDASRLPMPNLPELPQFDIPLPRVGGLGRVMPRMPSFGGGPSLPSGPSLGATPWLYLALALAVLGAGAWMARRWNWAARVAVIAGRPLPPLPAAIITRAQLRRVFEALALARLGEKARPWNHVTVARRWSDVPEQAAAAEALAHLYELARYTPGDERLTPGEQEQARLSLAVLAGGTA